MREWSEHVDEAGMPRHLPMPVNRDGNGPVPEYEADHYRCWCADDACIWTKVLRDQQNLVYARVESALYDLKKPPVWGPDAEGDYHLDMTPEDFVGDLDYIKRKMLNLPPTTRSSKGSGGSM